MLPFFCTNIVKILIIFLLTKITGENISFRFPIHIQISASYFLSTFLFNSVLFSRTSLFCSIRVLFRGFVDCPLFASLGKPKKIFQCVFSLINFISPSQCPINFALNFAKFPLMKSTHLYGCMKKVNSLTGRKNLNQSYLPNN